MTARLGSIAAVERLAASQLGLFSVDQARAAGVGADALARRSGVGGRWWSPASRVYALVAWPAEPRHELLVAQLSLGARAVLSHQSAGLLLGLDGIDDASPVHVTVPTGGAGYGWVVHRRPELDAADVRVTGPFRHTAPLRTLVDLASSLDDARWERALESALRQRMVTIGDLGPHLRRQGKRGAVRMRRVLGVRGPDVPPTGSELETRFVQLVRRSAILPLPDRQVPVVHRKAVVARVDLAWPDRGLFVECDGVAFHVTPQAVLRDRDRQNEIVTLLGWRPLRYTWDDVVRRPTTTLRKVEAAYRSSPSSPR